MRTSVVVLLMCAACGAGIHAPAGDPTRAALFRDLQRIVTVREATGWQIDRVETDAVLGDALQSVCRVDADARRALLGWIDEELERRGGSARSVYLATSELRRDLLELERIRGLLDAASATADRDCPFWVQPERPIRGRPLLDHRFVLVVDGGGKVIGLRQGGRNDLAGGGSARLLIGHGFGSWLFVATGIEGGGSGSFPRDENGDRGDLTLGLDLVFPVAVRLQRLNSYLELEGGPLWRVVEDRDSEAGLHVGIAVGVRSLRTRWFTPGLALAASYEQTFGDDLVRLIKVGLRVTVDIGL